MKVWIYRLIFIVIFCLIINLASAVFLNGKMPASYMRFLSIVVGIGASIAFPLDKYK